jgi:hypothetical protein
MYTPTVPRCVRCAPFAETAKDAAPARERQNQVNCCGDYHSGMIPFRLNHDGSPQRMRDPLMDLVANLDRHRGKFDELVKNDGFGSVLAYGCSGLRPARIVTLSAR